MNFAQNLRQGRWYRRRPHATGETMSDERLERIEAKIDGVIIGQAEHSKRLDRLEIGQEELNDKVKQIAEGHAVVLRELDQGFVSLQAVIRERLEPLEETVRQHSAAINSLRSRQ
jgi:hypothetical protein